MLKISILKVESPSCLWGRVVCSNEETMEHYINLQAQMNLFYHDLTQDLQRLKPKSLEEGQVYVVFWAVKRSWCRAVVESIITDPSCCRVICFLVDHGEMIVVSSDKIRVLVQKFLQLPFWVRKFHLARIKPTTLRVSLFVEKAELEPSSQWDCSATLYLHNLLQASTQTEAVIHDLESESTAIELYLTISNIKICVNDDLVANRFAYYSSSGLEACDRFPLMMSSNILTQTISKSFDHHTEQNLHSSSQHRGSSESPDTSEVGDWLPQSRLLELVTCEEGSRSEATKELTSFKNQSKYGPNVSGAERFLKFLNPGTGNQLVLSNMGQKAELKNCQPEVTILSESCTDQELHATSMLSETNDLNKTVDCRHKTELRRSEEDRVCSRLLEWLNPEPFTSDSNTGDEVPLLSDPWVKGILCHSAISVEPCKTLEDAPITDSLRQVLNRKNYHTLFPSDRYSWPAVARGCNTLIISQNADEPLGYLIPLLTHILLNSILLSQLSSSGPIAVLLCPGWEKAQVVYDLLEDSKVSRSLHPVIVLVGTGKDEVKAVKIPKNCLVLVTTPFTFVRLLSCHCFLFLRLHHLLLDEADQLFTLAPDQMATILQHFQKVSASEEKTSCPRQLVAAAKKWTSPMEDLISCHMPNPSIVITVPEEAALYGNIQQVILMTFESNKISVLLGALDFSPDVGQKTLIVANSVQEVEDVFKAVRNKSAFCLKTHEGLLDKLDFVIQQWKKNIGPGTHVILVSTSECLKFLGIRDATCVVHYGFPSSPKQFGSRLFCMAKNFRNLSEQDQTDGCSLVTRSVLLISEENARHVVGILRYLERTDAPLPPVLLTFAEGVHVAREDLKTNRPFCSYLKSFGMCRDRSVCPDRHRFNPQLDQSAFPAAGVIEVLPLYIKTASVYYGRLVRQNHEEFESMASEMFSYYADKKPGAKELLEGALYAVQEEGIFHRVKILSLPDRGESLFYNVLVQFIDIGKEVDVKSHQILELPEQFHSLPYQAIEMVVCRVKPVDAEIEWHPKVTRAISQKIRGLQHRARVVLGLGNTVFVDPMVRVTQMPGTKTLINEYNVQSEILKTGMGVSNPEHLDFMRGLGQDSVVKCCTYGGHTSRMMDSSLSEEHTLAMAFRVAEVKKVAALDPSHQQAPAGPEVPLLSVRNQKSHLDSDIDFKQKNVNLVEKIKSIENGREIYKSNPAASLSLHENGMPDGDEQVVSSDGKVSKNLSKSLYPHIIWYQTCDSLIVTVKLMNPESQRCDFYTDRVVYRSGCLLQSEPVLFCG
ncbi:putative ATP-dependent RNA helicase TDRD12 isoform X4 [Girardinichthys multiradiatus]|uniref:putative ATP-dependent RNA helicase TDRD12 isoform X4 n=1 Tax=Girardinichthys multiradiatus TaxID=208333 RepID=UPI001FAC5E08|nr:putative ATP-dependent RNA helicase TDRD12 isoform X4 [Girardinichthys multiradiatus]